MLRNLDRALARLQALGQAIKARAAAETLSAARQAADGARARAPVDTGRLRSSLRAEQDGMNARMLTDCPYARAVEFGTAHTPPQPFMRGE